MALLWQRYVYSARNSAHHRSRIHFPDDLRFSDVKLADIPARIARRNKTPTRFYQGGVRSMFQSPCIYSNPKDLLF